MIVIRKQHLYCILTCITLGSLGCSGPDKVHPRLLDSAPEAPEDESLSAESERLRKMQMIRVIDTSVDPERILELSPDDFIDDLLTCGGEQEELFCITQETDCAAIACFLRWDHCLGQLLAAIASGTGSSLTIQMLKPNFQGAFDVRVPPQSAATSAALALQATSKLESAMALAAIGLDGGTVSRGGTPLSCLAEDIESSEPNITGDANFQGYYTASFIDAFETGKRAYRVAYKNTLAVSDAELSSSNNLEIARTRAIANESLSRTAAAHLMIGGEPGWLGSTKAAFCTEGRLTGPEQAALSVFREAAPHPSDVVHSNISTDALVNGSSTGLQPQYGSVKQRLSDSWGAVVPAARPIWEAYGLKETDFDAARKALSDEIEIFGRSYSAVLSPRILPGGETAFFNRYAATAGKPPDRPDEYWALLSLLGSQANGFRAGEWRPEGGNFDFYYSPGSSPIRGADNFATFVDRAYSWARFISSMSFFSEEREVIDPFTLMLSGEDIQGRLTHCTSYDGSTSSITHRFRAAGYKAEDELVLVRGEDIMSCAVEGHIEGAPCELPNILELDPPSVTLNTDYIRLTLEYPFSVGPFETEVEATFQGNFVFFGRYYLISPRQKGDTNPGPGAWDLLLGAPLFEELQEGSFCREIPIVPEAIESAGKAITPSRDWCGSSEVSCAGVRFDERLPLEDELSTDHDDIESSWKHYLELARRAVDHADALGQEYVEAALQDDIREEEIQIRRIQREEQALGEFQRIQEICGSSANPSAILELLGADDDGNLDLSDAIVGRCTPAPNNRGMICGPRKMADDNPDIGAIAACLGTLGSRNETHLGNGYLCAVNEGVPVDPDGDGQDNIPRILVVPNCSDTSTTENGSYVPDNVGPDSGCDPTYHCIPKEDGLNLFDTASLIPDPPLPQLCDGIRMLRAQPVEGDTGDRLRVFQAITQIPAFKAVDPSPAQRARTVLSFQGGLPVVTVGRASTAPGSPLCGATTACPNGGDGIPRDGLFCRTWNCADASARAELNLRLYKAGAALGGSIDTIWYLNDYLQPSTWTSNEQWRLFKVDNIRWIAAEQRMIGATSGSVVGFRLGSEQWTVDGDEPTAIEDPNLDPLVHPNNKPMRLAFRERNAVATTLAMNLLDHRPTDQVCDLGEQGECQAGEVNIGLKGFSNEQTNGLGGVSPCFSPPNEFSWDSRACDLNFRSPEYDGNDSVLEQDLLRIGLTNFPYPTSDPDPQVAPATGRTVGGHKVAVIGKQVFPPAGDETVTKFPLDVQARLDAVEILCEGLGTSGQQLGELGCGDSPPLGNVNDFERAGAFLECIGIQITRRAATAVYSLPAGAVEFLRNGERAYDATGGSLNVGISDLRASLLDAAMSGPIVGGTLERFGHDLRALRAQLEKIEVEKDISDIHLEQNIAQQTANCLASVGNAFSIDPARAAGGAAAAAATCVNSIAQIGFAIQLANLEDKALTLDSDRALAEFAGRASEYVTTLQTEAIRLSEGLEGIQKNLEIIEGLQAEARRAMQSAVWHLSRQAANQTRVTNVLDNLKVGKYIRYQRAFEDAQKMAFFAKRSIEMRLGMSLADMVYDLPLVEAPAGWEASVCQSTGIDYAALRHEAGQGDELGEAFADAFLGEYVTKLEQVVESYRLVNNFHEGNDTVVVSLRDDIHNTRASCDSESPNRLYWASSLEPRFFAAGEAELGWTLTGCEMATFEGESGAFERPDGNCIVVRSRSDSPFFNPLVGAPPVPAWNVEFGDPAWCGEGCAYRDGAALSQAVELVPGRYRLSWYTPDEMSGGSGTNVARVRHADGAEFPRLIATGDDGFVPGLDTDWSRVHFEFDVVSTEMVTVGFERPSAMAFAVPIAAPMLERLEDPHHVRTPAEPPAFSDTTDVRREPRLVCEDTTGENFRMLKWDRNCVRLCPDGYASTCADQARTECFWETSFHVSQRSIEAGHIFNQSGFARGNYNYRMKSVAVNFVGTDLRSCEDSNLPSTCNAAGFIPYSILHAGPYYVRNHMGQDYRAHLFPGRIEHARGLGIERYVTNPIGESDKQLLEPYMRSELNGRPLDGEYIIRVWDEPGVNFNAIQDVQLIVDYGYWTRFN